MRCKNFLFGVLCVGVALISSPATAQEDPTREASAFLRGTAPANPIAGQPFVLNVFSGACEFLSDVRTGAYIRSIVGNTVTIYIDGTPDLACSFPTGERQYDLPGIPVSGDYRFRVFFVPSIPGGESVSIGTRNVAVVAQGALSASPLTVPATDLFVLVALTLLLLGTAAVGRRGL